MKGNALLVSMLLASGAAYSMNQQPQVTDQVNNPVVVKSLRARLGSVFTWMGTKATGAKTSVVNAFKGAKGAASTAYTTVKSKVPTLTDIKAACSWTNIKAKVSNIPTLAKNNKLATGAIVLSIPAVIGVYKLWNHYKKNGNSNSVLEVR